MDRPHRSSDVSRRSRMFYIRYVVLAFCVGVFANGALAVRAAVANGTWSRSVKVMIYSSFVTAVAAVVYTMVVVCRDRPQGAQLGWLPVAVDMAIVQMSCGFLLACIDKGPGWASLVFAMYGVIMIGNVFVNVMYMRSVRQASGRAQS